jgi:NADP-dependent 3-hydroxy acid dehydrogenase YdfG
MNKTILITGSSSGIGKATARLFHQRGWNVIASMRSPDAEAELTALPDVLVTRLDVEDPASITAAVEAGIARFGAIDVLLNNAGYGAYGLLEATSMAKIERQFGVNVLGLLAATKAVLPHFRARRSGTIVNISSIGGKFAFPLGTLYHGTNPLGMRLLKQALCSSTSCSRTSRARTCAGRSGPTNGRGGCPCS